MNLENALEQGREGPEEAAALAVVLHGLRGLRHGALRAAEVESGRGRHVA